MEPMACGRRGLMTTIASISKSVTIATRYCALKAIKISRQRRLCFIGKIGYDFTEMNDIKNMETKTITYLNSKIWYRFFKVGFIFLLLVILLIFNGIIMSGGFPYDVQYAGFSKVLVIGNLLILLFFEILRRVFYYIVSGSLRPEGTMRIYRFLKDINSKNYAFYDTKKGTSQKDP